MFARIGNLIRGFFNLFITRVEESNPKALVANIEENMRKDIATVNQGLITHQTQVEMLKAQVKRQTAEVADLRAKAAAYAKVGKMDAAKQAAFDLQKVQGELTTNQSQLDVAEKTYVGLVKMREQTIAKARKEVADIKANISETERNNAMANLMTVATGMIDKANSHGDQLSRVKEMTEKQRATSAARMTVASGSVNFEQFDEMAAQEDALKDQALADFLAKEGISVPGAPEKAAAETVAASSDPNSL